MSARYVDAECATNFLIGKIKIPTSSSSSSSSYFWADLHASFSPCHDPTHSHLRPPRLPFTLFIAALATIHLLLILLVFRSPSSSPYLLPCSTYPHPRPPFNSCLMTGRSCSSFYSSFVCCFNAKMLFFPLPQHPQCHPQAVLLTIQTSRELV